MNSSQFLQELDRSLRSSDPQIRSDALLQFPSFLKNCCEKLVIHQSFLKLCEFLVYCSNHERLLILKIFQIVKPYSETQDRSTNDYLNISGPSEEMMKKILIVLNTNDSVSRSICLGICSCLRDFLTKEIHHRIHNILECVEEGHEMQSVVKTAESICEVDPEFTRDIYPRVRDRIRSVGTPSSIKLEYMKLLRYLHDSEFSNERFRFLRSLLVIYPSIEFSSSILKCIAYLGMKHTIKMAKPTCELFLGIIRKKNQDQKVINVTLNLIRKLMNRISEIYVIEYILKESFSISRFLMITPNTNTQKFSILSPIQKQINFECLQILGKYFRSQFLLKYLDSKKEDIEIARTFLKSKFSELVNIEFEETVMEGISFFIFEQSDDDDDDDIIRMEIEELWVFRICEFLEMKKKKEEEEYSFSQNENREKKKKKKKDYPFDLVDKYEEFVELNKENNKHSINVDDNSMKDEEEEEGEGEKEVEINQRIEYLHLLKSFI